MSAGLDTWPSMILSLVQLVPSPSLQMHSDGQTPSQSSPFLFSSRQPQTRVKIENTNVEPIDLSGSRRQRPAVQRGCPHSLFFLEEGTAG